MRARLTSLSLVPLALGACGTSTPGTGPDAGPDAGDAARPVADAARPDGDAGPTSVDAAGRPTDGRPRDMATDGPVEPPDAGDPFAYPDDERRFTGAECAAEQSSSWTFTVPPSCAGRRVCFSGGRTYRDGEPWIIRGLYSGGHEAETALSACPEDAPCQATQPADAAGYVRSLADAGFNLVIDRLGSLSPELRAALSAEPRIGVAVPLFGDVFTQAGHDALVAEIEDAAADPDVLFFFGPDEPDKNRTWPMAAGIARLLRGSGTPVDALLAGRYAPAGPTAYLPETEPAHDPNGLPYASAVVIDETGLRAAPDVYDAILPVTYPYQEAFARADEGDWSIRRTQTFARPDVPMLPVLQMIGIEFLHLVTPSPGQIRAEILGTLALGAAGAFYFQLASDVPRRAGRAAFYAPDDAAAWRAYAETHALWERMTPVLYGDATVSSGTADFLVYRRFSRGDRRVLVIVNPTPYDRAIDLDGIVQRAEGETVRTFADCAPFTTRVLDMPGYFSAVLEVVPRDTPVPVPSGDALAAHRRARPATPDAVPLDGMWETLAPLSVGRSAHVARLSGDGTAVLVATGYTSSLSANATASLHGLSGGDDTPTAGALVATASAASAVLGERFIVAGGTPSFPSSEEVVVPNDATQCFDGSSWSACAAVGNGPVAGAAFASFDGALYLAGGTTRFDPDGAFVTQVVQRYVADEDRWLAETHLPEPRVSAAALAVDGVLYIIGGRTFAGPSGAGRLARTVLAYDLVERRWLAQGEPRTVRDLPTPRAGLACALVGGHGYCVGGYNAAGDALAVVERLDVERGEWSTLPSLPEALSDTVALDAGDALVVAGGLTAGFLDGSAVYRLR